MWKEAVTAFVVMMVLSGLVSFFVAVPLLLDQRRARKAQRPANHPLGMRGLTDPYEHINGVVDVLIAEEDEAEATRRRG